MGVEDLVHFDANPSTCWGCGYGGRGGGGAEVFQILHFFPTVMAAHVACIYVWQLKV